jgi:hypothetical protein
VKRRNPIARELADPLWRRRTVPTEKGGGAKRRPRPTARQAEELRLLEWENEEREPNLLRCTWRGE